VCGVGDDGDAAEDFLEWASRLEEMAFVFYSGIDSVIIADDTSEINWDDGLGRGRDRCFHLIEVHLIVAGRAVDHDRGSADVADDATGSGVGVRGDDDLIARSDAEKVQCELRGGGLRAEAGGLLRMTIRRETTLEFFSLGTGGDPAGSQGLYDLGDLEFSDIRG